MSLATRCSACGTIFRVVEDQLRVSDGWVRCGRCAEVFDARAQLFDIDNEAPPPWPAEVAEVAVSAAAPMQPEPVHSRPEPAPAPAPAIWPQETPAPEFEPDPSAPVNRHAAEPELEPRFEAAQPSRFDVRQEPHWSDETQLPASTPSVAEAPPATESPSQRTEPPALDSHPDTSERPDVLLGERLAKISAASQAQTAIPSDAAALPEFLRAQAPKTKWQGHRLRIALSLLALALLSALLLQVGLHFRNRIAALQPGLRPILQATCDIAGCVIEPWQHIEGIGVESSALNQAGAGNHYQLVVGLRNKSDTAVATPWVDVSLTDSAGALVAKRILGPLDFKTDQQAMAAGSDLTLKAQLSTGSVRVSGYSVEIFYP